MSVHRFASLILMSLLAGVIVEAHADAFLPALGGQGGSQFIAKCPAGQNLTGFELRAGYDIDAIRPVCVESYGPTEISAPEFTTGSGLVSWDQVAPGWYGGPGGGIVNVLCPADAPVVHGINVVTDGRDIISVNSIELFCGAAGANQNDGGYPSAIYEAPQKFPLPLRQGQRCPSGQVATGVHGRYGEYLDAMGLICNAPRLTKSPGGPTKAIGREIADGAPRPHTSVSICAAARKARARKSPAANGLEEQCRALSAPPAKVAEVAVTTDVVAVDPSNDNPLGSHGALYLDDLAEEGAALASADPLFSEFRSEVPGRPESLRGFDIGMAAMWGKSKMNVPISGCGASVKIREMLSAAPERGGFDSVVKLSCDRIKNAKSAATGAAIALADPIVAAVRTSGRNSVYRFGFDIATGLFGDPALGAAGNTAMGPGSLAIRKGLWVDGQQGFDASVKLHLSRKY